MAVDATVALATLAEAKAFIKKTDDKDVSVLEVIMNAVGDLFNQHTDRHLLAATYTALYLDGNGERELRLPNYPVSTLTSVYEDEDPLTEGIGYDFMAYLDTGRLSKPVGERWMWGPKTIKVTYTAGYSLSSTPLIPNDLKLAYLIQVGEFWQKFLHASWGELSRSLTGQSVTVTEKEILPIVKTMLLKHRRLGL